MARDGQLPRVFSRVSPNRRVPTVAMIAIAVLSVVIGVVAVGQIELVASMVVFGALSAYILLHITVIVDFGIRHKSKRVFLHWISPILGILVLGYALVSTSDIAKIVGLSWLVVGAIVAVLLRRFGRSLETSDVA
jgi:amino acid transporter